MVKNDYYAIFADAGLGKTISTLKALEQIGGTTLIIAPIRVCETVWRQEAQKINSPLTFSLVRGTAKDRNDALKLKTDVYLINPELLSWLFQYPMTWDNLVVDESSMFKSPSSQRFKILKKKLKSFKRRYILTATPSPNSLLELWSQIGLLDMGARLGTAFTRFRDTYFYSDFLGYNWTLRKGSKEKIEALIQDIVIRLDVKDYLDLPDFIENDVYVELSNKEMMAYKKFAKDFIFETLGNEEITAISAAALHSKLSQLANGMIYNEDKKAIHIHDHKFNALQELIEIINSPTIVIYKYKHELEKMLKMFPQAVQFSDGDVEKNVKQWNVGNIEILLLHPMSGGHGLNLQEGGNNIIWFGPTASLEQYIQSNARIHRSGQQKPVVVHKIITKNTVDEHILGILLDKNNTQKAFLNAIKRHISSF